MTDQRYDAFAQNLQEDDLIMIGGQFYEITHVSNDRSGLVDLVLEHEKTGALAFLSLYDNATVTFRRPL